MAARAFSLIELLVVITIIGILVAIAVPYYGSYKMRVNLMQIFSNINIYIDKSIEFAQTTTGPTRFGNCVDVGASYSSNNGDLSCDSSQSSAQALGCFNNACYLVPDGHTFTIGERNGPCGKIGTFLYYQKATTTALMPASIATDISFRCDYWHTNGGIERLCGYSYEGTNGTGTTNLVPGSGWVLVADAASGLPYPASYYSATCQ